MIQDIDASLSGGGTCGEILRRIDWAETPLGISTHWPAALKTMLRVVLSSRFPMMIHWGPPLITFYNDAYAPSLGTKHPGNLGRPAYEWWSEMWDDLSPIFDKVLAGGTFFVEDARYDPDRADGRQEAYFTHCHSPLWGDDGKIEGIFLVVTETTRKVKAEQALTSANQALSERVVTLSEDQHVLNETRAYERAIIESSTEFAIIATAIDGTITRWNEGAHQIMGWTEDEMRGQTIARIFTQQDRKDRIPEREVSQATNIGHGRDERWHLRKDGSRFWAAGMMMPLKTEDDINIGFLKVLQDRTAERLVQEHLAEASDRLDAALETGLIGFFEWTIETNIVKGDRRFATFYGLPINDAASGVPLDKLSAIVHPDDRLTVGEVVAAALAGQQDYYIEFRLLVPAHPVRWVAASAHRYARDGQPVSYTGVVIDVTTRKAAEENQKILTHELQHRVKNILSVVGSIASQTFRQTDPHVAATFLHRLAALASAQDILLQGNWQAASIRDVVEHTIKPHVADMSRFQIHGPPIELSPKKTLSLALGLHELATNAAKYGALSIPEGTVDIAWSIDEGRFRFVWREHHGPLVTPPTNVGFGSRLIDRAMNQEFHGGVTRTYSPSGVVCEIACLAEQLSH